MDILANMAGILVSAIAGSVDAIGLVMAYLVNARTRERKLNGSLRQRVVAYGIGIAAAVVAYVIILLSAGVIREYTEQTFIDALFFIGSAAGVLLLARKKLRKRAHGVMPESHSW